MRSECRWKVSCCGGGVGGTFVVEEEVTGAGARVMRTTGERKLLLLLVRGTLDRGGWREDALCKAPRHATAGACCCGRTRTQPTRP